MKYSTITSDKATAIIKGMTTKKLIEVFIETGSNNDPHIPTVRGWIMDELEARNPEAFEAWLDDYAEDADLPNYFGC